MSRRDTDEIARRLRKSADGRPEKIALEGGVDVSPLDNYRPRTKSIRQLIIEKRTGIVEGPGPSMDDVDIDSMTPEEAVEQMRRATEGPPPAVVAKARQLGVSPNYMQQLIDAVESGELDPDMLS